MTEFKNALIQPKSDFSVNEEIVVTEVVSEIVAGCIKTGRLEIKRHKVIIRNIKKVIKGVDRIYLVVDGESEYMEGMDGLRRDDLAHGRIKFLKGV